MVRAVFFSVLGLSWVSPAISQSLDPMQPPADRRPAIAPGESSLAAAILEALSGDARVAERVNVLKRLGNDRVTALIEAENTQQAETLKATQSATLEGESLVIRSDSGERIFSPHPLVQKTPRPAGSAPAEMASPPTPRSPRP